MVCLKNNGQRSVQEAANNIKERKKRRGQQGREGRIYPTKQFPKNSKESQEGLLGTVYKTRTKQQKGKDKHLFRKIGDIKATFCPKKGTIKDINSRDLVDAEKIKRWK